jgi:hypothetical protein
VQPANLKQTSPHQVSYAEREIYLSDRMKSMLVFVVRHGEREDEAFMMNSSSQVPQLAHRKLSKEDKLDPKLTPQGHCQAFRAFENLLSAMEFAEINKVAVFSSPLRRAVGTAMMLSTANTISNRLNGKRSTKNYSGIQFVLPSTGNAMKALSDSNPSKCIPVVVENGLSNCTALMMRSGGSRNLVRANLLSCAAMPRNSLDHPENHIFRETLDDIKGTAMKSDEIREAIEGSQTQGFIQFWRIEEGLEISTSKFVPMAPPISVDPNFPAHDNDANNSFSYSTSVPASYDAEGQKSIDRVVRLAISSGCDACIVSSHREEIRDLYRHRCGFERSSKEIPYCCIGVFEVYLDECWKSGDGSFHQPESPLQWIVHNVVAPEVLSVSLISEILSQTQQSTGDLSFPITYPVIERTTLFLCEACLLVDNLAFQHSISGVKSVCLNGVCASRDVECDKPSGQHHFDLHLQIARGHHSWMKFLQRLHDDVAIGFIEYGEDHSLKRGKVLIRPNRQMTLPCPPKIIIIEVVHYSE